MMILTEAIDLVVARTRVERYRYLCLEHPNPRVRSEYSDLVMRLAADLSEPAYPPITAQIGNLAGAVERVVKAAVTGHAVMVSESERQRREAICATCEHFDAERRRCRKCGCGGAKLHLATERCPLDPPKWDRVEGLSSE